MFGRRKQPVVWSKVDDLARAAALEVSEEVSLLYRNFGAATERLRRIESRLTQIEKNLLFLLTKEEQDG